VTQSCCNWIHSKIIFRIQIMTKVVIWIDLKVPSLCTYQIWSFLILKCSTCSEESIDYKFVISGDQRKIYELFGIKVLFKSFEIHFKILCSNHVILLHIWILNICRIPMIYYLLFLDSQIRRYEFSKI
jgi:hypothetical protein